MVGVEVRSFQEIGVTDNEAHGSGIRDVCAEQVIMHLAVVLQNIVCKSSNCSMISNGSFTRCFYPVMPVCNK